MVNIHIYYMFVPLTNSCHSPIWQTGFVHYLTSPVGHQYRLLQAEGVICICTGQLTQGVPHQAIWMYSKLLQGVNQSNLMFGDNEENISIILMILTKLNKKSYRICGNIYIRF